MAKEGFKLVANNKKAYHDYFIEEKYEAGLALHGTEAKSLGGWGNVPSRRLLCCGSMNREKPRMVAHKSL